MNNLNIIILILFFLDSVGIKQKIKKSVNDAVKFLTQNLSLESEFDDLLKASSKEVSAGIFNSLNPEIEKTNKFIDQKFRIPENVVLTERPQIMSAVEEHQLEEEVKEMELAVQQNAFFLSALNDELLAYENLEETVLAENAMFEKVEAQLGSSLGMEILENLLVNKLSLS